jgi:hypothetical protein
LRHDLNVSCLFRVNDLYVPIGRHRKRTRLRTLKYGNEWASRSRGWLCQPGTPVCTTKRRPLRSLEGLHPMLTDDAMGQLLANLCTT